MIIFLKGYEQNSDTKGPIEFTFKENFLLSTLNVRIARVTYDFYPVVFFSTVSEEKYNALKLTLRSFK